MEYLNTEADANTINKLLTDGGLEVESMELTESVKGGLKGLVIGKVLTCEKHPNADKLSITTVDIGNGNILPIVCGAPNVGVNQKVVVATEGTTLYSENDSFEIKKSKIRGETSEGMICAEDEIGLGLSHEGIMILDEDAKIGMNASDYFNITTDYVFELGITPNRADATSHIGVARDLVSLLNFHKKENLKLQLPSVDSFKVENSSKPITIEIENQTDCPRYSGITISGVTVAESPDWLKNRLRTIGIRPINNIVDITNFVLMETGQPLHAFDYDKITSKKVKIQKLADGTIFKTLDEIERKLTSQDLMICNDNEPMCMGGIFGGFSSGVTLNTKNIFLESAYFNPVTIRKSSKYHNLKTDASFRFERGADPNITIYALKRAALLIKEIAKGEISSEIIDIYPTPINPRNIDLEIEMVSKITGHNISNQDIIQILSDLDIKIIEESDTNLLLEVPTCKVDVTRPIDVIEEILRIYSFNNIPVGHVIKSSISYKKKPNNEQIVNIISDLLVSKGYYEAMNNSLSKSDYYSGNLFGSNYSIPVLNPLSSELNILRQHLIFGLLESLQRNINFKTKNVKLFEFGKHYSRKSNEISSVSKINETNHLGILATGNETDENWNYNEKTVNFYTLKSILLVIFNRLGIQTTALNCKELNEGTIFTQSLAYQVNGKPLAEIGLLNKVLYKHFDLSETVYYADIEWDTLVWIAGKANNSFREISKYPAVRRDLALLVDKKTTFAEVEQLAMIADKKLIKSINLFDVYEGKGIPENKKSYAISITIQDDNKTLTDGQVDKLMGKVQMNLERNIGAVLR